MNAKIVVPSIAVGYAILRYGIVKGVPLENWPAFIGNKALAITAVMFLVLGIFHRVWDTDQAKDFFRLSLWLGFTHGITSLAMMSEAYYGYLYNTDIGRLNVFGELTIIFGALALALYIMEALRARERGTSADLLLLTLLGTHVVSVGVLKWLDPSRWAYGLIPISLIGFLILVTGGVFALRQKVSLTAARATTQQSEASSRQ